MRSREPMGNVDTAWLHMDRAENTADVVAMLSLAEPMGLARVRRLMTERLLPLARFRQRVVEDGLLGGAVWEKDPRFSIDRHVIRRKLRRGGTAALQELVGEVATEPLDPARPPWRMILADGFGKGSAIVVKVHHCVADGFALVGVLLSLADKRAAEQPPARRAPSYRDLAFGTRDLVRHAASFAGSLARMAALPSDPPTLLKRPLSGRRHAAWSEGFPLARLQEAARSRGATVNDLLVAALTGALRGHLVAAGESLNRTDVRALIPVNLRPPGTFAPELGNRFGLVFLSLPIHARTAASRLGSVRTRMKELKGSPDAVVTHALLGALGAIPRAAEQPIADFFTHKASLVVTNLPGPTQHLHLGGNRIDSVMFWVPHPALLGVGVSILSYAGEVRIGVRADAAVMPDPADLVARFGGELRALGAA